MKIRLLL